MTQLYRYYQVTGGTDPWVPIQADQDLTSISPTFVTVLNLDTILDKDSSVELREATKYLGPMYFDLDDKDDVTHSIIGARLLVDKFKALGLQDGDIEVYLSGKKGLHLIIPEQVFMQKPVPTLQLPAIYKEIAFHFAVDTVDFKVYTARMGRMLRTCCNVRENGNYKVPVTIQELQSLDAEGYNTLCKAKRQVSKGTPAFRPGIAIEFDKARQKVHGTKKKKSKPVDQVTLRQHEPVVKQLMAGINLSGDIGFNKIAIQICLYAREAGIKEDDLIQQCQGLIANHSSDGRYNNELRREHELRRMHQYIDDNHSYEYGLGGIKSCLSAAGSEAVSDSVGDTATFSCGVIEGNRSYLVNKGEAGDVPITNFIFENISVVLNANSGRFISFTTHLKGDSNVHINSRVTIPADKFLSQNALSEVLGGTGVILAGSDLHTKGMQQIMLKKANERTYVVDTEGVNLINVGAIDRNVPELQKPFIVWADMRGVQVPEYIAELGYKFIFQGYPDEEGVIKTDLTDAPTASAWLSEAGNLEVLDKTLRNLFECQSPEVIGKMLGWMIASFWRQLFHKEYGKFPLLHVYGPAGAGKTELTQTLLHLFFYRAFPQITSPGSTPYAFLSLVAGSGSIPVVLDEYKPQTMQRETLEKYRATFRDAYNMKDSFRGGGNRFKESYAALNKTTLSSPIVFLAEALETETAIVERVVLVTLKRPSADIASRTYAKFQQVVRNQHVLSVIGHLVAAKLVKQGTVEAMRDMFEVLQEKAVDAHMLRDGDSELVRNGDMTSQEYMRRANNRLRNVYNNTVAQFGLIKFRQVVKSMLQDRFTDYYEDMFQKLEGGVFNNMDVLSDSAIPEYIKVLTTMSDMTRLPPDNMHSFTDGYEYALTEMGTLPVLVLTTRSAYNKYRAYCRFLGQLPLYNTDASFTQALRDSSQYIKRTERTKFVEVEAMVLNLEELYKNAVPRFAGKLHVMKV